MTNDIKEILVTKGQIEEINERLGKQISRDYQGKELVMVVVLKGAFVFASDLIRHISIPMSIDFMVVSSYGNGTKTSGVVKIIKDLGESIEGKSVLIAEDILDSGVTLSNLIRLLKTRNPASIDVCAMLDKPERRICEVELKYKGQEIPDEFVVGYGLDYDEKYRNLPYIGVLKEEVYTK